jgi:hypothetical protein
MTTHAVILRALSRVREFHTHGTPDDMDMFDALNQVAEDTTREIVDPPMNIRECARFINRAESGVMTLITPGS